ncbi:hypothetical protein DPX16_16911 [Anabarilius grahami]|uniref:Uncharacterized protein n=1 Tax=Anabarilius grahami TaxID=495550 RepID=A0A3N0YM93_ANAGA|nr:hypothetical protein DPX16_16911 [Anabarilius grahami]
MVHDLANQGNETVNGVHDLENQENETVNGVHDLADRGNETVNHGHDLANRGNETVNRVHDLGNQGNETPRDPQNSECHPEGEDSGCASLRLPRISSHHPLPWCAEAEGASQATAEPMTPADCGEEQFPGQ